MYMMTCKYIQETIELVSEFSFTPNTTQTNPSLIPRISCLTNSWVYVGPLTPPTTAKKLSLLTGLKENSSLSPYCYYIVVIAWWWGSIIVCNFP